jgi:hypothetical protein
MCRAQCYTTKLASSPRDLEPWIPASEEFLYCVTLVREKLQFLELERHSVGLTGTVVPDPINAR